MSFFTYDYQRFAGNRYDHIINRVKNWAFHRNIRFLYWLRKAQAGSFCGKVQCYRYSRKYGLEISPEASIGKGLYLGHPYNITVGGGCVLGDNINLHKGCTVGSNWGSPVIGNCVWIGINATVVGKITVGDDVLIVPGAYVNFDVPFHSVVIGNPGEFHYKENATEAYIGNRI